MMTRAFHHSVFAISKAASEIEKSFVERIGPSSIPHFLAPFFPQTGQRSSICQCEQYRASSIRRTAQDRSRGFPFGLEVSTIYPSPSRSIPQRST